MADDAGRQDRSVADALYEEAHLFEFQQALHLLELEAPSLTAVGEAVDAHRENVRLRAAVRLDFPAAQVEKIARTGGPTPELTVNVLGLAGMFGPLPDWMTELVMDRTSRGDTALRDFLDLFNHRLLSLLYRGRKKYRPALDVRPPHDGRVPGVLYSLIGLGTPHLRAASRVDDRALLQYAGILAASPRSTAGLERVVSGYFDARAKVVPFRGRWEALEESDWTILGRSGRNQELGVAAVLGRRVFDPQATFEVVLGPLPFARFFELLPLPENALHRELVALVRFCAGDEAGFVIRLVLERRDAPDLRLGPKRRAHIGWTTWLRTNGRPLRHADGQVVIGGQA